MSGWRVWLQNAKESWRWASESIPFPSACCFLAVYTPPNNVATEILMWSSHPRSGPDWRRMYMVVCMRANVSWWWKGQDSSTTLHLWDPFLFSKSFSSLPASVGQNFKVRFSTVVQPAENATFPCVPHQRNSFGITVLKWISCIWKNAYLLIS